MMKNIFTIFKLSTICILFSTNIFAAERSCPQRCLAKVNLACVGAVAKGTCLCGLCLAASGCTFCGVAAVTHAVIYDLPTRVCLLGACTVGICGYFASSLEQPCKAQMPVCCKALCCKTSQRSACFSGEGDSLVQVVEMPAQQTMLRYAPEGNSTLQ